jgi:hypothetical protein
MSLQVLHTLPHFSNAAIRPGSVLGMPSEGMFIYIIYISSSVE